MSNIVIDIAAQFTGKNAFKQAETSTDKLTKSVKSMAKTLGVAFSVQQVLAFGKASVQAAAADEKAQKQLALALKNVGLGRDAAASEGFIQKLQSEFGVVDDKLRPAYQQLALATRDTAESQKLLQLALDISASTGKDLGSVTSALSKAYLGSNTALSKLGVGISKADLKAKSFQEITAELSKTFAGSATQSANTFQGSIDKLGVASNNVKEIIGEGLINAFKNLGDDSTVSDLTSQMEDFATETSKAIQGISLMLAELKKIPSIPGLGAIAHLDKLFKFTNIGLARALFDAANKGSANDPNAGLAHLAELQAYFTGVTLKTTKKLTTEELKQLKAKQLQLAIDKANLALGKGSNVFDIEKIQLQAAEKSVAEQLGKVTSQAQLLQITNDLARLEVKQSILDLEDAIASKDVAAITNATNKLNADLGILGALTGQKIKLTEIESILKGILPKDLINLANLDAALAKLTAIGKAMVTPTPTGTTTATPNQPLTPSQVEDLLILGRPVPIVPDSSGGVGYSSNAGNYAPSGFPGASGNSVSVVNNFNGIVGDPNAVAELIDQVVQNAVDRGTLRVA